MSAPVILITGGSRGVGAATARLAAERGYDVAISYVSDEAAAHAVANDVKAAGRRALAIRADSADPEQAVASQAVWIASRTQSRWAAAANPSKWRGLSCGWRAMKLPLLRGRFLT